MRTRNRREFIVATGGTLTAALAGCLGSGAAPRPAPHSEMLAAASFFVFGDIAAHIAGDVATAETLVPLGQHGHGWEPGPDIQGRILESDVFVHGMRDFQPWADDVLTSLDADGADVATVDATADVDLHELDDSGHEDDHEETHSDDGDHDFGAVDPHFWMDPRRVATATATVRDTFQSVDDTNADAYAENTASYRTALVDLDTAFEQGLESRDRNVILVAGHDAFGYLAERYGLDVVALTGLSPDEEPSARDIERAQKAVEEHEIRHVLADPLESDRAARQLVTETDAEDVLPLTSIPGLTQEWDENAWGYIDIMRDINLPSLRTALDAR